VQKLAVQKLAVPKPAVQKPAARDFALPGPEPQKLEVERSEAERF